MQFKGPMLVVEDVIASRRFYEDLLSQKLELSSGAYQAFKSGLSLQAKESMTRLFHFRADEMLVKSHNMELYFETEEFDRFLLKLKECEYDIAYVHNQSEPEQYEWGQRAIRFYDPDGHMIEVGESLCIVMRRFSAQGLTVEDIAAHMDVPVQYVRECLGL